MSQTVIVIVPRDISPIALLLRIPEELPEAKIFDADLQVGDPTSYVTISPLAHRDAIITDYHSNDDLDLTFRTQLSDKSFYRLSFNDFHLARTTLNILMRELGEQVSNCWVDTDYGWVVPGSTFAKHLKEPSWDWRRSAPR